MITFDADLFRIAFMAASREETRFYLVGVHVEPHRDGGVILTATNGHMLVCIRDESGHAGGTAIIRLSDAALRACKSRKRERRTVVINGDDAVIYRNDKSADATELGEKIAVAEKVRVDGHFPDYRRVIPADRSAPAHGEYAAQYLGDMAAVAGELAVHVHGARVVVKAGTHYPMDAVRVMSAEDASSPALVLFPRLSLAFGVLMPVSRAKDDCGATAPAWFAAPVVEQSAA